MTEVNLAISLKELIIRELLLYVSWVKLFTACHLAIDSIYESPHKSAVGT